MAVYPYMLWHTVTGQNSPTVLISKHLIANIYKSRRNLKLWTNFRISKLFTLPWMHFTGTPTHQAKKELRNGLANYKNRFENDKKIRDVYHIRLNKILIIDICMENSWHPPPWKEIHGVMLFWGANTSHQDPVFISWVTSWVAQFFARFYIWSCKTDQWAYQYCDCHTGTYNFNFILLNTFSFILNSFL